MAEEAQQELKINRVNRLKIIASFKNVTDCQTVCLQKQARRVYEILRFHATNVADAEEYRAYRLDVKRRLNIPYQVIQRGMF